jgi:hypothetical protein
VKIMRRARYETAIELRNMLRSATVVLMTVSLGGACSSGSGNKSDGGGGTGGSSSGGSGGSTATAGHGGGGGTTGQAGQSGGSGGGGSGGSSAAGTGGTTDAGLPPADASFDGPLEKPGIFVAVGYGGRRVRSLDDGTTWVDDQSLSASGGDDQQLLRTVIWTGTQFVAMGYRAMTSPNGMTWQDNAITGNGGQWFGGLTFGAGVYIGVGGYGMKARSQDAIAWETHNLSGDTLGTHQGNGILYDPDHGHFVTTNDSGIRAYSSDGRTWALSTGATSAAPTELAMGNGVIIGAGGTSTVISSDGGVTWTAGGALPVAVQALVFAQGHFTGMGADHVFTSVDGQVWANHPITIDGHTMAYGHGVYVLFNNQSYRRSTDGISWVATKTLGGANAIQWVVFGPTG